MAVRHRLTGLALLGAAATAGGLLPSSPADAVTRSAATAQIADVSLSGGHVVWLDTTTAADGTNPVSSRTVRPKTRGSLTVVYGPQETLFGVPGTTASQAIGRQMSVLSTSAGRLAIEPLVPKGTALPPFQLRDRGVLTASPQFIGRDDYPVQTSGPWSLLERRVFAADGTKVLDLTSAAVHGDIYGPMVIYSSGTGRVRLRDLSKPSSASNPRTIQKARACNSCSGEVAVWGNTVAWTRKDAAIVVKTLPSGRNRVIKPIGYVHDLELSEGVLSWQGSWADDRMNIVDLRNPKSLPRVISLAKGTVDNHLMAGVNNAGNLSVRALPIGRTAKYRPRLIGAVAAASFAPASQAWAPQFDLSKPVNAPRLTISRAGATVRVLTGTAADGSVRDLSWNGLDADGNPAAAGAYSWRLTGNAADGDGPLFDVDGTSVTGTVTLTR